MTFKSFWDILDVRMEGELNQNIEFARSYQVSTLSDQ